MAALWGKGATHLLAALLAGTVKAIRRNYAHELARVTVPAAHRVLHEEQPGDVKQTQFRSPKGR
jgi:hypothetical protein